MKKYMEADNGDDVTLWKNSNCNIWIGFTITSVNRTVAAYKSRMNITVKYAAFFIGKFVDYYGG